MENRGIERRSVVDLRQAGKWWRSGEFFVSRKIYDIAWDGPVPENESGVPRSYYVF